MNTLSATMQSCRYRHPELGDVRVTVNGRARSIVARWNGAELRITIPPMLPAAEYNSFIERYSPRLLQTKPEPRFAIGDIIDTCEVDFSVVHGWEDDKDIFMTSVEKNPVRSKFKNYYIHLSTLAAEQIATAEVQGYINRLILVGAKEATARFVLPRARQLAAEVGQRPLAWAIKESRTRLGSCSSSGIITISPRLIFLPGELRDFVVYHELAHLSEMNHSANFHAVCNTYCSGREEELRQRLRRFRFPVF